MSLARLALSLLLPLLSMAQFRPMDDHAPEDAATTEAAVRAIGSGAIVVRSGHLSSPDQNEAIAVVDGGSTSFETKRTVSRLVVLRQNGSNWTAALTVDKVIRNPQGFLGVTSLDQLRRSDIYKVNFFKRTFDDGKDRFVIQLTPTNADGKAAAPSVYVSWNPLVGRYQQISLQNYGFEPEIHEPLPAKAQ
jgi:hypothetical protein